MKSIYDKTVREELILRIQQLPENSSAQWGKMTLYQMLKHCSTWEEMVLGKKRYKQAFIGRVFGKLALKRVLKDDAPLDRNVPTAGDFIIRDQGNVNTQKARWIELLQEHEHFAIHDFIHPFFGKMTSEQIGYLAYKHADHHLRQFNG